MHTGYGFRKWSEQRWTTLEFSILYWGSGWKAYSYSETGKQRISFLHIQAYICNSTPSSSRCRLPIYICRCRLPRSYWWRRSLSQLNFVSCTGKNTIHVPKPEPLSPNSTHPYPYVFVADEAFPLRTYIMKLYAHRGLNATERIFNYRLSRARRIVENAFGILATRFRVFRTKICFRHW